MASVVLNPADATGNGLSISNSVPQTSGDLVSVQASVGQSALHVKAGNVNFAADLAVGGDTSLQRAAFVKDVHAMASTALRDLTVDPAAANGGGVLVANSETQLGGDLVRVAGETGQSALRVSRGSVFFEEALTVAGTTNLNSLVVESADSNVMTAGASGVTINTALNVPVVRIRGRRTVIESQPILVYLDNPYSDSKWQYRMRVRPLVGPDHAGITEDRRRRCDRRRTRDHQQRDAGS